MSTDERVTEPAPTLLDDFLSGEVGRVLHATWETIASRDRAVLDALVPHAARIRRATEGLPLGGLVYANSANVAHALDKLERSETALESGGATAQALCIAGLRPQGKWWDDLFLSHPSIERRIDRLMAMENA